jgi:short-subunit dehydrogenase
MTEFNNAVVLITGAGGGFGRQLTRQFVAMGSKVILHDIDSGLLQAVQDENPGGSENVLAAITADLSDAVGCQKLFGEVSGAGFRPDILVNNAGIGVGGRLDLVPRDRWEQVMQVDLLSPMRLTELFLPQMIERGSGHIVNISSIAGWIGAKRLTSYCAAKFGLRGFSEALSRDVEEYGIKVSTIYPWFSRTPILQSESFGPEERSEVPDDVVTDPADVVAAMLRGIKKNKLHIFPDRYAGRIQFMKRHMPKLLDRIMQRMEKKMREESEALKKVAE